MNSSLGGLTQPKLQRDESASTEPDAPREIRPSGAPGAYCWTGFQDRAASVTDLDIVDYLFKQSPELALYSDVFLERSVQRSHRTIRDITTKHYIRDLWRPREPVAKSSFDENESFRQGISALIEHGQLLAARRLLRVALLQAPTDLVLKQWEIALAPSQMSISNTIDVSRDRDFNWLATHGPEFRGQWVAVSDGALIAASRSLGSLLEAIPDRELRRRALLHYVPD